MAEVKEMDLFDQYLVTFSLLIFSALIKRNFPVSWSSVHLPKTFCVVSVC